MEKLSTTAKLDDLTKVMVEAADAYYSSDEQLAVTIHKTFGQTFAALSEKYPHHSRAILGAGLLAAGFTIDPKATEVEAPSQHPMDTLDDYTYYVKNWHQVGPTVVEMGLNALNPRHEQYDPSVKAFVEEHL